MLNRNWSVPFPNIGSLQPWLPPLIKEGQAVEFRGYTGEPVELVGHQRAVKTGLDLAPLETFAEMVPYKPCD